MFEKLFNSLGSKLVGRSDFTSQFNRYRETVLWLLSSLFIFDKWRLMGSLANNMLGVTIQGGALTLLMIYGSFMENNRKLVVLGIELDARDHNVFFTVMISIGLLLAIGGILKFVGSKMSMRLSTDFAGHCSYRAMTMSATYPTTHPAYNDQYYPPAILVRVTGLVFIARGIRPLLAVSNPLTVIIYGLAALLYLNAGLTLILLLLSIPTLLGQYIVNYNVVQNEKKLIVAQRQAKQELQREITQRSSQPTLTKFELSQIKNLYEVGNPKKQLQYYTSRRLAGPKSSLISDLSTSIIAVLIISILGNAALQGSINWVTFLSFLVFSRLTLLSFRGILKSITGFARHYPKIRGTYELLKFSRPNESKTCQDDRREIVLATKNPGSVGDVKKRTISTQNVTGIFCKSPISRYNSPLYLSALQVADSSIRGFLVSNFECLPRTFNYDSLALSQCLEQFVAQRSPEAAAELIKLFDAEKLQPADLLESDRLPEHVDCLSPIARRNLSAAIYILTCPGSILFIDFEVYQTIESQWAQLLEMLEKPKYLFICSTEISEEFVASCELIAGINSEREVALMTGQWAVNNIEKLNKFLETKAREIEIDEDDDDDDE